MSVFINQKNKYKITVYAEVARS